MNAIEQVFGAQTNNVAPPPKKELGQEDFLKLMVAQLKNQDPNNPADNGEFLSQIAQFSMVSGIDDLGVSFDGIAGSLYTGKAMEAAKLVNSEVLIETDTANLVPGDLIEGMLDLNENASVVKMQIHDTAGSLVSVLDLGNVRAGMQRFDWNGLDENGEQMPAGEYVITAEGLVNGKLEGLPLHIFSTVESVSVDRSNTNVVLNLANNERVDFSQIREYK